MKTELIDVKEDNKLFDFALKLIFEEWGDGNTQKFFERKQKLKTDNTKSCYVLNVDGTSVGCFVVCKDDIKGFETFSPNLACVCVKKEFRKKVFQKF